MQETDDYALDARFGHWLKDLRTKMGISLEEAAQKAWIPEARLKSLEVGYSEKGITRKESESLSRLYNVPLSDFLKQAAQD